MPLRRPLPGTYESLLEEVRLPVQSLVRLSRLPKTEPYWSQGRYRFDGPLGGTCRTTYAAELLEVAFCESVIHEGSWFNGTQYEVSASAAMSRHVVRFKRAQRSELLLADFTGEALKRLGLNNDISAGDDYTIPQAWAEAVHASSAKWDGIRYVSRQNNKQTAVALFERSGIAKASSRKLGRKQLDQLCDRFKVLLL